MMSGGARPDSKEPFRPSGRQIGGGIIAVLLLIFIVTNTDDAAVTLVVTTVTMPLWLVLAGTALLGVVVGIGLGSRRTKRKYMNG